MPIWVICVLTGIVAFMEEQNKKEYDNNTNRIMEKDFNKIIELENKVEELEKKNATN